MDKDVTELVEFDLNDDEALPLTQCVCGAKFPAWTHTITVYRDGGKKCPNCGRCLYFTIGIRVYEIGENDARNNSL